MLLSPYIWERNCPESGGKCHPNFFQCQLGKWGVTLASNMPGLLLWLPPQEAHKLLDLEEVSDTRVYGCDFKIRMEELFPVVFPYQWLQWVTIACTWGLPFRMNCGHWTHTSRQLNKKENYFFNYWPKEYGNTVADRCWHKLKKQTVSLQWREKVSNSTS